VREIEVEVPSGPQFLFSEPLAVLTTIPGDSLQGRDEGNSSRNPSKFPRKTDRWNGRAWAESRHAHRKEWGNFLHSRLTKR
jgi:hypothetical protein